MDVCKCIVPARHGGTLNSRQTASPLVMLVEREERFLITPREIEMEPSKIVLLCMVLKVKANNKRKDLTLAAMNFVDLDPMLLLIRTPISDFGVASKRMDETFAFLDPSIKEDYGNEYFNKFRKFAEMYASYASDKLYKVIDDLVLAITLEHPSKIYRPSENIIRQTIAIIIQNLPTDILDFFFKVSMYFAGAPVPKKAKGHV
ncbi:UNVERIFIED_CONTAM: hypothetical protein NCL1_11677 [Trichonephila clavipes]